MAPRICRSAIEALTAPVVRSFLVKDTIYKLNSIARRSKIEVKWTRAHVGTEGNERADTLAKEGTKGSLNPEHIHKISMRTVRTMITPNTRNKWCRRWQQDDPCRQTKVWWPKPAQRRTSELLKENRQSLALLTQAMTGFNNLAYHSHNKNNSICPNCRLCGAEREDFAHLATDCPRLNSVRENTFGNNGPDKNWSLDTLIRFTQDPRVKFLLENRKEDEAEWINIPE